MPENFPVIIGAAQLTNRSERVEDAIEPAEMMEQVARSADEDAGARGLLAQADSVQVVGMLSWQYRDAPGVLAERIGASPSHKLYSSVGGETPQRLVNETAQAIAEGRTRIALIAGAEALSSRRLGRRTGTHFPWPKGTPEAVSGDTRAALTETEARHGATLPTRFYPLFENAIRAHLGLGIEEHQRRLGELCSRFTRVAAENPYAWFPEVQTPEEITAIRPDNRWVCFPYPKLMNAIIEIDQAAALIVTGSETARELGVPEDRWVYLWGCGDANDRWFVSERPNYYSSPGIRAATGRALGMAGLNVNDIAAFDLYSCFPSAVQLALDALGLKPDDPRPLTVTGGLPYAGGPGNNYVSHSITTMVHRLRERPHDCGLVTGLGWFVTKHSAGVYSARRPSRSWQRTDPAVDQSKVDAMESPAFEEHPCGEAVVETYTVAFNREGEPEQGIVIGRLGDGSGPRFFANTAPDASLLWGMTREEFVGRPGRVEPDAETGRNVFTPE
ncbi:MAG TPA: acetyl-CoA acetyltransferase [Dehalococcoidia bacterium]|nr:acetyl-CoA acetyltransferase [Dehalococcoidia bacterium]